jgi:transposase
MPSKNLLRLKSLLSLRERMVKERAAFKTRLKEYTLFLDREENALLFDVQSEMIDSYDLQIQKVEDELYRLVKEDEKLAGQYNLVTSIKGIGPQTAMMMIVITNGFTLFDGWRKFASYSGIAPFPNSSGKYKGKTKTNNLANKRMKTLLSCCAVCAIRHNPEMRVYYQQRVAKGKNEMSTLNIIRNKLVSRAFAVVQRETPYVDTSKYAA